jgi:hypothetical protein
VLATEDHGGGGAPVNSERGKSAMPLTLSSATPMEGSMRFVRWWQSYGRDLVGCGVMTRACGRGELAVALLVGERCERRREAREMRKTERGSRFCFQRHARAMPWHPLHARATSRWPDSGTGRPLLN